MPSGEVLNLSRWLYIQRQRYRNGSWREIDKKLNEIGFDWSGDLALKKEVPDLIVRILVNAVGLLSDYVRQHGHALIKINESLKGLD